MRTKSQNWIHGEKMATTVILKRFHCSSERRIKKWKITWCELLNRVCYTAKHTGKVAAWKRCVDGHTLKVGKSESVHLKIVSWRAQTIRSPFVATWYASDFEVQKHDLNSIFHFFPAGAFQTKRFVGYSIQWLLPTVNTMYYIYWNTQTLSLKSLSYSSASWRALTILKNALPDTL